MAKMSFNEWPAITADDATIKAALEEANIPALMAALAHLTGSTAILRGDIQPNNNIFRDPQSGIAPEQQAKARAMAFEIITAYRDAGSRLPPVPDENSVREMMHYLIGQEISPDYVQFLMSELALNGEDPYSQAGINALPQRLKSQFKVAVIGAGMSGILAGIRLKEAGIPYVIFEKNGDVGGTWYENTYPGCRVDSPNHSYSYSFAPNDWPQYFSSQAVLRDYFDRCATEYGIRDAIHFNTEVVSAEFDETSKIWRLHLNSRDAGPRTLEFNAIISAVGQLNRPKSPDIEGRDRFKGIAFHSAQWQHQHDLRGMRIAVIGTGASAFQFVPEMARTASEVLIFQRTPPWLSPRDNYHDHIPEGKHWLLNNLPFYTKWFRFLMFWQTSEGLLKAVKCDPDWHGHPNSVSAEHDQLRQMLTHYLTQMVGDDPALLAKVIPDYPPAGKRMCVDNGTWIRALKRDNVQLFTDGIGEITETGLTTRDGQHHAVDVIIYGTGFKASRLLWPMQIIGRGGVELQQQWNDDPHAYLGITVPGYPNLFCLYGPNTNIVVNGSIIFFSESEMRYIMLALQQLLERNQRTIECKQSVHDAYNDWIDAGNQQMAWGSPRVQSWYKNSQGRVTQNWPYTLLEFWRRTRTLNPDDYQFG